MRGVASPLRSQLLTQVLAQGGAQHLGSDSLPKLMMGYMICHVAIYHIVHLYSIDIYKQTTTYILYSNKCVVLKVLQKSLIPGMWRGRSSFGPVSKGIRVSSGIS